MRRFWLVLSVLVLAACGASPKSKADSWARAFPQEIGGFEQGENRLALTLESPAANGHVTLTYLNRDDVAIYVTIDSYGNEDTASVRLGERLRDWNLQGVRFERERVSGKPIETATTAGGYLAYFQDKETLITLAVIPPIDEGAEGEAPVFLPLPSEDIALFLETLVALAEARK
jgi:hypothetical protein